MNNRQYSLKQRQKEIVEANEIEAKFADEPDYYEGTMDYETYLKMEAGCNKHSRND